MNHLKQRESKESPAIIPLSTSKKRNFTTITKHQTTCTNPLQHASFQHADRCDRWVWVGIAYSIEPRDSPLWCAGRCRNRPDRPLQCRPLCAGQEWWKGHAMLCKQDQIIKWNHGSMEGMKMFIPVTQKQPIGYSTQNTLCKSVTVYHI